MKCQHLITNYASTQRIKVPYRRAIPNSPVTNIWSPFIQPEYNRHACYVDVANKMIMRYWWRPQYRSAEQAYFYFFINVAAHQAYIVWNNLHLDVLRFKSTKFHFLLDLVGLLRQEYTKPEIPKNLPLVAITDRKLKKGHRKRCSYAGCRNKTTKLCYGCGKHLCLRCMEIIHLKIVKRVLGRNYK